MKTILVIIDGAEASDYYECSNIDYIKKVGETHYINNTPFGLETNSLTCILNILGVEKEKIPKGRAYLEALSLNEHINESDLIFRCNNVRLEKNILVECCNNEDDIFLKEKNAKLINLGTYKNLLIIREGKKYFENIITYAPHENFGENINNILPKCKDNYLQEYLRSLIYEYNLYPWAQSVKENLPSFYELHNKKGAVVCKTEIISGIGKAMGMYVPKLKYATADVDTNLMEKAIKTLELSSKYDFVMLHINGADESAHRKNREEKVEFIKKIDREVIGYLLNNIDKNTILSITSDHSTCSKSGRHINEEVPKYTLKNIY